MLYLTKNKYWNIQKEHNLDKILYLLIDRPTRINPHNDFIWMKNKNEWHREYDLPTFVNYDGYMCWCENNRINRKNNKPTKIWPCLKK